MSALLERARDYAPPVELTPVGWQAGELPYEEWLRHGSRLGLAARSSAWWVGDWVRYGTSRYGNKYAAAARVTGYDRQTLMNMVYVASRFEPSRRRENLSWSHHAELAALDRDEQEGWLQRASEERLSVRDLRDLLPPKEGRSAPSKQGARKAKPAALRHEHVCPACGHHFAE